MKQICFNILKRLMFVLGSIVLVGLAAVGLIAAFWLLPVFWIIGGTNMIVLWSDGLNWGIEYVERLLP